MIIMFDGNLMGFNHEADGSAICAYRNVLYGRIRGARRFALKPGRINVREAGDYDDDIGERRLLQVRV